jgi:two-component sensor histidine kinase
MEKVLGNNDPEVGRLLLQQEALAEFGSFAFRETDLMAILTEAARICAASLEVPFCKICRYRSQENDLLIVAGCGWDTGVIGRVISQADDSSPQGRAYVTREPVIIRNLQESNDLVLPPFYAQHGIVSTVDVVIKGLEGAPYGVLEIDSPTPHAYNRHDITFLTGFANVLAEAVATQTRVQALKAVVEEKNLLAQEMHHRVRNNLFLIQGMLDVHAGSLADGLPKQGIETIARRVMTLAQVYEHLLGTGMSHDLDFGAYVRTLCASLPDLEIAQTHNIDLTCTADSVLMLALQKVSTIGMVIAELVSNSYGHAFSNDRNGTISVSLSGSQPNGSATLTVKDDGIGFDGVAVSDRHGLKLVRRLAKQVDGSLDLKSDDRGTTWKLTFPTRDVPAATEQNARNLR